MINTLAFVVCSLAAAGESAKGKVDEIAPTGSTTTRFEQRIPRRLFADQNTIEAMREPKASNSGVDLRAGADFDRIARVVFRFDFGGGDAMGKLKNFRENPIRNRIVPSQVQVAAVDCSLQ